MAQIKGSELVGYVREKTKLPDLLVIDIVRQSTLVKRQLPGLSKQSHLDRVCAHFVKEEEREEPAADKLLRALFPSANAGDIQDALRESDNHPDTAAALLMKKGFLSRRQTVEPAAPMPAEVRLWYIRYFANMYAYMPLDIIREVLKASDWDFSASFRILETMPHDGLATRRQPLELPSDAVKNGGMFRECFVVAETLSRNLLKRRRRQQSIRDALAANLTGSCLVCYDSFTNPELVTCDLDTSHTICEPCLCKYISTELFEEGRATKKCVHCPEGRYSEMRLHDVLPKRTLAVFASLETKTALANAGITEATHTCKCGNCVIVPDGCTVHMCAACGHGSCVLCNEENHIPLRCDEVEKDADAKIRHKIEEAMTEALLRKCECGQTFIKESGCNKMTCKCGRKMCYLCKEAITGYDHFGGPNPCKLFAEYEEDDKARVAEAERLTREKLLK